MSQRSKVSLNWGLLSWALMFGGMAFWLVSAWIAPAPPLFRYADLIRLIILLIAWLPSGIAGIRWLVRSGRLIRFREAALPILAVLLCLVWIVLTPFTLLTSPLARADAFFCVDSVATAGEVRYSCIVFFDPERPFRQHGVSICSQSLVLVRRGWWPFVQSVSQINTVCAR
jgi:hypothetical protein